MTLLSSLLPTTGRLAVVDANASPAANIKTVAYTSITAPRTVTLPLASTVTPGNKITIVDESGSVSASVTITVNSQGSDKINTGTSYTLNYANAFIEFENNGSNTWVALIPVNTAAINAAVANVAGFQIGDTLNSYRNPGSSWLKRDGSTYNTSTYPTLAALMPGNGNPAFQPYFSETIGGINNITYFSPSKIWGAVGDNRTLYYSTDRINWTQASSAQLSSATGSGPNFLSLIVQTNNSYYYLLTSSGYVIGGSSSNSALSFTGTPNLAMPSTSYTCTGIWGTGSYIYVTSYNGATGAVYSIGATTGSSSAVTAPGFAAYAAAAYQYNSISNGTVLTNNVTFMTNGTLYVAGAGGKISLASGSTTSATYTTMTSNTTSNLYNLQTFLHPSIGLVLIATGANGAITYTTDGTTWTSKPFATANTIRTISLTGSVFRFFADNGVCISSSDLNTFSATSIVGTTATIGRGDTDGVFTLMPENDAGTPTTGVINNLIAKAGTQFQVPNDSSPIGNIVGYSALPTGYIKAL